MFEHLSFWEIIGPLVATIATIIALFGKPFNENYEKIKRLTVLGSVAIILALIGLISSLKSANDSNIRSSKTIKSISENFDSLKIQNSHLLKSDSINGFITDSLNSTINALRNQLINISLQELQKEKQAREEHYQIIRNNLMAEIESNLDLIEFYQEKDLNNFKNIDSFLTGQFSFDALKDALSLPLSYERKKDINKCINQMKDANELISSIKQMKAGNEKSMNINSLIRFNERIYSTIKNLKVSIK